MSSHVRLLARRMRAESAFSLVEIMVVLLVLGILTGIALPTFLNQRYKSQDAQAKANVRNALSLIEHCYSLEQDYTACDDPEDYSASGIRVTPAAPARTEVQATGSATGFVLLGRSRSDNTFEIAKSNGIVTHDCDTAGTGGCPGAGSSGLSDWTDQAGPEGASGGDAGTGEAGIGTGTGGDTGTGIGTGTGDTVPGTGTGTGTGTGNTLTGTGKKDKKDKKDK